MHMKFKLGRSKNWPENLNWLGLITIWYDSMI